MDWNISEETSLPIMILIALGLGLRHGLDLDHLATIDAITRTAREHQITSKCTGVLFSLGHGIVITIGSILIGAGLIGSHVPEWLEEFGSWVSIFFLLLFGALNVWSAFQKTSLDMPKGLKSYLTRKIALKKFSPTMIMGIGALFAFSFDTFSQIALFAISATFTSGWLFSGFLGLMFTIGMMITDGGNGLFVSHLIQRADKKSQMCSRLLGLSIAGFSLGLSFLSLIKLLAP